MSQQPPLFTLPPIVEIDGVRRPTVNSAGRPIHPSPEGVRAFWEWFGDSQAVDAHGRPLVVYHGTGGGQIDVFQPNAGLSGGSGSREGGIGSWFTNDHLVAWSFSDWDSRSGYFPGGNVLPVYLSIQNAWKPESYAEIRELVDKHTQFRRAPYRMMGDLIDYEAVRLDLLARGFDGISLLNTLTDAANDESHDQHVALRPEQIKSVTGNRGTFDPTDPDITRSVSADYPDDDNPKAMAVAFMEGAAGDAELARARIAEMDYVADRNSTLAALKRMLDQVIHTMPATTHGQAPDEDSESDLPAPTC